MEAFAEPVARSGTQSCSNDGTCAACFVCQAPENKHMTSSKPTFKSRHVKLMFGVRVPPVLPLSAPTPCAAGVGCSKSSSLVLGTGPYR